MASPIVGVSNVGKDKCIIVIALSLSKNQPRETLRIVLSLTIFLKMNLSFVFGNASTITGAIFTIYGFIKCAYKTHC